MSSLEEWSNDLYMKIKNVEYPDMFDDPNVLREEAELYGSLKDNTKNMVIIIPRKCTNCGCSNKHHLPDEHSSEKRIMACHKCSCRGFK